MQTRQIDNNCRFPWGKVNLKLNQRFCIVEMDQASPINSINYEIKELRTFNSHQNLPFFIKLGN